MKQADEITLKAFLIALEQLNEPLPEAERIQLQEIAKNIDNNLGKLDAIAGSNPKLDALYQEIRIPLQDEYTKRNKGGFPKINKFAEQNSTETSNFLLISDRDSETINDRKLSEASKSILKMDAKTLVQKFGGLISKV